MKNSIGNEQVAEKSITNKDINKCFFRWYVAAEMPNSYERMQGVSFCYSLIPILKKLYNNKKDYSNALLRHLNFFNTQGTWGTLIHGITAAMEEQKANGEEIAESAITGVKTGLMGPLAGIGDTIDWGTLKTIIYALAVTFGMRGSAIGAFVPILFVAITLLAANFLWKTGYKVGKKSVTTILHSGWIKELISGTSIMGLFMMGALSAKYVSLSIPLSFTLSGGTKIGIQSFLDGLAPGLLPLLAVFGIYWILKKKRQNYALISIGIVVISIFASLIGLL